MATKPWSQIKRKKVSKASVQYREAASQLRHCGNCAMFHNGTCDLVMGKINRTYVCNKWVKK